MTWPVRRLVRSLPSRSVGLRSAYTLLEILVSTVLTLMLLMAVVQIFGSVSQSIANSRSVLEMADQLRAAQMQLQRDLEGVTVTMRPPRRPESGEGYFEYTEGPIGPVVLPEHAAANMDRPLATPVDTTNPNNPLNFEGDATVADRDDMILFTTRAQGTPFVGRVWVKRAPTPADPTTPPIPSDTQGQYIEVNSAQSQEAEVAWFVRGRTLYRRVLLVLPNFDADLRQPGIQMQLDPPGGLVSAGFWANYDISVHNNDAGTALAANSLSDLTKPENRFAHRQWNEYSDTDRGSGVPYHAHFQYHFNQNPALHLSTWARTGLGLPILCECSYFDPSDPSRSCFAGALLPPRVPAVDPVNDFNGPFDAWRNPHPWTYQDPETGALRVPEHKNDLHPPYMGSRISEDVILTNVIGFDVKAWDPNAPVVMVGPPVTNAPFTLVPGDRGYIARLREALDDPQGVKGVRIVSHGAYVDLNYLCRIKDPKINAPVPANVPSSYYAYFGGPGDSRSGLLGTNPITSMTDPPIEALRPSVYDTWSTHFEHNGVDDNRNGVADEGTDGFDNDNNGVVDGPEEAEVPPPYPVPLRGIQVRIRVFEPSSRQIREVTVVQDFLPK